jgi:AcrR family transcriptional regulator
MPVNIRSQRESAIMEATLAELAANGPEEISMQVIASRCGLTRTAIYQYFSSVEDVFAELVINDMADLVNEIERHVSAQLEPIEQVRVWIHYSLAHLSTGDHTVVRKLSERNLPETKRGIIRALHGQFMLALLSPVSQISPSHADSMCHFIAATVNAAANRIETGSDFTSEAQAVEIFVLSALNQ